ncbi:MAG TPA: ubiquinol-cytochrome c reductase cytochrome b subunit [Acidimicrobiia bacterium]|nr:ubiquinol-cytochrome c reductase cytochrome b subunit [Acidimicrobiia bacterium]
MRRANERSRSARAARWFDERLGSAHFSRKAINKVFPDHWSFMLGEVAFYCFIILVATGIFLTVFFHPSHATTVYHGSYAPLAGASMSRAYASAIGLSFDVRAGLLMRQMHHWAALIFLWAILAHVCRIFFTGAFRRPREINWIVGVTLLVLVILNDFLGYSLIDDLLSGTGLRIAYGIVESIPIIGTWMAYLLFGGPYPGDAIIPRMFVAHVLLIPLLIVGLLGAHLGIVWRQKHTHFPGTGRRDDNVVGSRLWPVYAAKSMGLFAIIAGVIAAMGAFFQINPIWLYGPYEPSSVTTYAQPDYALGWVEGAMRLFPGWDITIAHSYRIPAPFWPAVVFPSLTFVILYAWPFIDKVLTRDRAEHHVIDRPRDRPGRSAFGMAVLTFYAILLAAGSQDIIASELNATMAPVTWTLRISVLVVPVIVGMIFYKLLRDLHDAREQPEELDAPIAPNEVPAVDAPSPVGPAPELLPSPPWIAAPTSRPRRPGVLRRAVRAAIALVLSAVIEAATKRHERRARRAERKRDRPRERLNS